MTLRRAVFLDRDGTINENRSDHVKSLDEFVFLPGALEALRRLAATPLAIVIVSNQSVINRGLASAETVHAINRHVREVVEAHGGRIDAFYFCPHRPDEQCTCRKPQPGLLYQAQAQLNLDLKRSYMVGDAATDVEVAQVVGCRPILVLTGRGAKQLELLTPAQRELAYVARDLPVAVDWIVMQEAKELQGVGNP